jgi:hypothetical protein
VQILLYTPNSIFAIEPHEEEQLKGLGFGSGDPFAEEEQLTALMVALLERRKKIEELVWTQGPPR